MKLSIVLTTVLATFATSTPNLCDDVYLDPSGVPYMDSIGQMLSRFCEWSGPDAPIWDANVCCTFAADSASCTVTDGNGRCASGKKKLYCEHGAANSAGAVTCYQPFPDACGMGFCVEPPDVPPPSQESFMCCSSGGACQELTAQTLDQCEAIGGVWFWCDNGTQNSDGTIDCWD